MLSGEGGALGIDGRADYSDLIPARYDLENVTLQRAHLYHLVQILIDQWDIEVLGVVSGDEELAGAGHVDRTGCCSGQRAVPQSHEVRAALIAVLRGFKNFVRLQVEETEPHGAMTHDAFQVPAPAAAAILFVGVE